MPDDYFSFLQHLCESEIAAGEKLDALAVRTYYTTSTVPPLRTFVLPLMSKEGYAVVCYFKNVNKKLYFISPKTILSFEEADAYAREKHLCFPAYAFHKADHSL